MKNAKKGNATINKVFQDKKDLVVQNREKVSKERKGNRNDFIEA